MYIVPPIATTYKIMQSGIAKKVIDKPKCILNAILKCQNKTVRKNKGSKKQKGQTENITQT